MKLLAGHHLAPFDRMLIAQATAELAAIVSRDSETLLYGVPTIPA